MASGVRLVIGSQRESLVVLPCLLGCTWWIVPNLETVDIVKKRERRNIRIGMVSHAHASHFGTRGALLATRALRIPITSSSRTPYRITMMDY